MYAFIKIEIQIAIEIDLDFDIDSRFANLFRLGLTLLGKTVICKDKFQKYRLLRMQFKYLAG